MKKLFLPLLAAITLTVMSFVTAFAHEGHKHGAPVVAGTLELSGAWTRATLPGQPAGGGFVIIKNNGSEADRLLSASSPLTPMVQVHEMKMEGDVMKMAELKDGLEIPAGATVELKPGGFHIMFMGLKDQVKEGDVVKVTLKFEKAGEVVIDMPAQAPDAKAMGHDQGNMDMDTQGMADPQAIEHIMKAQFDKPEAPLAVSPIVVKGDFAVGGWAQDKAGGYALLKKADGKWTIHLCTGGAVKDAANLVKMSVPEADAKAMAETLAAELSKLDPALVSQLDSFEGTVMIEGGAHHHGG